MSGDLLSPEEIQAQFTTGLPPGKLKQIQRMNPPTAYELRVIEERLARGRRLDRLTLILKAVLAIAVVSVGIAWFINREKTTWPASIPSRLLGDWHRIEDVHDGHVGVQRINLGAKLVSITSIYDWGGKSETSAYPLRRVSLSTGRNPDEGSIVLFIGEPDSDHIAERQLEIFFSSRELIVVHEIIGVDPDGEDVWRSMGQFVRISQSRGKK